MAEEPKNDTWYQNIWYRFLDKLRARIGLQKASAIDKDPFHAALILPEESKETVEGIRKDAETVQKLFPPMSKWWVAAGVIMTCSTIALGLMFVRKHFKDKEDGNL